MKKEAHSEIKAPSARVLGKSFWSLADKYGWGRKDQALMLGIKPNRQRLGDLEDKKQIPDGVDVFRRVSMLLGIHKNLRILYAHNPDLVYNFFTLPFERLGKTSPLEFLHERKDASYEALFTLRRLLDQMRVAR